MTGSMSGVLTPPGALGPLPARGPLRPLGPLGPPYEALSAKWSGIPFAWGGGGTPLSGYTLSGIFERSAWRVASCQGPMV